MGRLRPRNRDDGVCLPRLRPCSCRPAHPTHSPAPQLCVFIRSPLPAPLSRFGKCHGPRWGPVSGRPRALLEEGPAPRGSGFGGRQAPQPLNTKSKVGLKNNPAGGGHCAASPQCPRHPHPGLASPDPRLPGPQGKQSTYGHFSGTASRGASLPSSPAAQSGSSSVGSLGSPHLPSLHSCRGL